jgi:hypothetical protein
VSRADDTPLHRALAVSQQLTAAAEAGDAASALELDAARLSLLKEARRVLQPVDDQDRELVREISRLNERAIGFLQHAQRTKARDLDMVSVGRRAVHAYSATRLHR